MYAIMVRSISAAYPTSTDLVLNRIDLELPPGELIALVGPNGAGKSTLFKIIVGQKKALRGQLRIFGEPTHVQQRRGVVAYAPQEGFIDWDFPIEVRDVVLTGRYNHLRSSVASRLFPFAINKSQWLVIDKALEMVGMKSFARKPISALSGGQKKRVFLARALAQEASILLLDEPFNGVDKESEETIIQILLALKERGCTIIMASHDLNRMREIADRAIVLNKRIIADGSPEKVLDEKIISELFQLS